MQVQKTKGGHRKIPLDEAIRYVRENGIVPQSPALLGFAAVAEGSAVDAASDAASDYHQALAGGNSDQAVQILQRIYFSGQCVSEIFDNVVLEALGKIGQQFPDDRRSIFIEHRAIVICMRSLMQLRSLMPVVDPAAKKAICAAPSGDPYLLPSLMCSLVLHEAGFADINLGPDTPLDILLDAIEDETPRIICLSVTSVIRSHSQIREIEKLNRSAAANGCSLIIGGKNAEFVDLPDVTSGQSMQELKAWAEPLR